MHKQYEYVILSVGVSSSINQVNCSFSNPQTSLFQAAVLFKEAADQIYGIHSSWVLSLIQVNYSFSSPQVLSVL